MCETEICLDGVVVGRAAVTVDGLYAHIKCSCCFPNEKLYALYLKGDASDRLLGTCTPQNGCFVLDVKLPKKYIHHDSAVIYAAEKYTDTPQKVIRLVPGEPIVSVEKLDRSVFRMVDGAYCLLVFDST